MAQRLLDSRLAWLGDRECAALARLGLRGLEKECLRVDAHGRLSKQPHPAALGAALTHPYITTDYSEALLEFVTPPFATNWEMLQLLCDIHCFVAQNLEGEMLWPQSMPCIVEPDADVPIAYYGESNLGRMKTIYRRGLGHRYGRAMQAIAGIHFNYSLPTTFWPAFQAHCAHTGPRQQFRSESYLALARNYRRHAWTLVYLFGASPAVCKSFPLGSAHGLDSFGSSTWYLPYGTSLRMSDIGYRNKTQAGIKISLNSFDAYLKDLAAAVSKTNPDYEQIGVEVDGDYRQLNTNVLQIENEYYTAVRPKPKPRSAPRTLAALRDGGVHYVEVRTLDLSPADPVGVNQVQLRFVEALLLYCLLADSPAIDATELAEIDARDMLVAREGRRPGLELPIAGRSVKLTEIGTQLMRSVAAVAEILDGDGSDYAEAVRRQQRAFEEPDLTPSARMLADMAERKQGFLDYTLDVARAHHAYFQALSPAEPRRAELAELALRSLDEAEALERSDREPFASYLAAYLEAI